jgi:hypothetical protein
MSQSETPFIRTDPAGVRWLVYRTQAGELRRERIRDDVQPPAHTSRDDGYGF